MKQHIQTYELNVPDGPQKETQMRSNHAKFHIFTNHIYHCQSEQK